MNPSVLYGFFNDIKKHNDPSHEVFQSPVNSACVSADTDGASESDDRKMPLESELGAASAVLASGSAPATTKHIVINYAAGRIVNITNAQTTEMLCN